MIKQGTLIAVGGELYEYDRYDKNLKMHFASEIIIDDEGHLVQTYILNCFSTEDLKDNAVNFTEPQWYGIVVHFIRQAYDLTEEDIEMAAEDIVYRCFAYGVPTIEELPEYIAEYLNR